MGCISGIFPHYTAYREVLRGFILPRFHGTFDDPSRYKYTISIIYRG